MHRGFSVLLTTVEKPFIYCGIEQLVARHPHKVKVVGSSPTPATRVTLPDKENKCRGKRQRGSGEGEKVDALFGFDSWQWRGRVMS